MAIVAIVKDPHIHRWKGGERKGRAFSLPCSLGPGQSGGKLQQHLCRVWVLRLSISDQYQCDSVTVCDVPTLFYLPAAREVPVSPVLPGVVLWGDSRGVPRDD